jgi:hypothetical protein
VVAQMIGCPNTFSFGINLLNNDFVLFQLFFGTIYSLNADELKIMALILNRKVIALLAMELKELGSVL